MTLDPTQTTLVHNEVTTDPRSLYPDVPSPVTQEYADAVAVIMNTPGTASYDPPIKALSDTPVMVLGAAIMALAVTVDNWDGSNNPYGAGVDAVLDWMNRSNDPVSKRCQYFWNPAALFNIADSAAQNLVDYLAGVDEVPFVPQSRTLISEQAMEAIKDLGMVVMSRARELISRPITGAEVYQALTS